MTKIFRPFLRAWLRLTAPRMRYGVDTGHHSGNHSGAADAAAHGRRHRPHSRIGSHTHIEAPERLSLGDHVFIGHFNFIDASGGLEIGTGCQITNHVSVLTHSSHRALRLEREAYWGHPSPAGLLREPVVLGEWSFIGPHSTIAPGTRLGSGVLVRAYSFVSGEVPDFAVVEGQPARVVGDTRELDRAWMEKHAAETSPAARAAYETWATRVEADALRARHARQARRAEARTAFGDSRPTALTPAADRAPSPAAEPAVPTLPAVPERTPSGR